MERVSRIIVLCYILLAIFLMQAFVVTVIFNIFSLCSVMRVANVNFSWHESQEALSQRKFVITMSPLFHEVCLLLFMFWLTHCYQCPPAVLPTLSDTRPRVGLRRHQFVGAQTNTRTIVVRPVIYMYNSRLGLWKVGNGKVVVVVFLCVALTMVGRVR